MRRTRRSVLNEPLLLAILLVGLGFLVVAVLSSAAVALLGAASERVEPPVVWITGGPPDPTNRPEAAFQFTSSWASAALECALGDGAFGACRSPWSAAVPEGRHRVRIRALDLAGGRGREVGYEWTVDLTPPALDVPADLVVEATGADGAAVPYPSPSASDASGIAEGPSCSPAPGATLPLGTTTVTCSATDGAGNRTEAGFRLTIHDTRPPELVGVPADIVVQATGPTGATVAWTPPIAIDRVSGEVPVACSARPGAVFPLGRTEVRCEASDEAGNRSEARVIVDVVDTVPPVLAGLPSDITAEATGREGTAVAWAMPTARDLVSGAVPVRCAPPSGSRFPLGSRLVRCAAGDAAGNIAVDSFAVVVRDTRPPRLTVPETVRAVASGEPRARVAYRATAVDEVDGAVTPACTPSPGSWFPMGTTPVSCEATDAAGNRATASFAVVVADTTPPEIDARVAGTSGTGGWYRSAVVVSWDVADRESGVTSSQGCGRRELTQDTPGATLSCRATSAGGTRTRNVTVRIDRTAPVTTLAEPVQGSTEYVLRSSDTGSGVATIEYQVVAPEARPAPTAWSTYSGPLTPPCGRALWARATDRAGNREVARRLTQTLSCVE